MRYRTKLLLVLSALAVGANALAVGLLYQLAKRHLLEGFRAKAESIAATVATFVDGDLHRSLQADPDEKTAAYAALRKQIARARDVNRREDTWVKNVITIYPSPKDPKVFLIGVDPEESVAGSARPGEVYRMLRGEIPSIESVHVDRQFTEDEWGKALTATAPIKDAAGNVVAAVRVEFSAERVHQRLEPILYSGLAVLAAVTLLSLAGAFFLASRVSRPLDVIHRAVNEIGKGNFDARAPVESRDEFGVVAGALNAMAAGLKEREVVKTAFARYVSRQVMDNILSSGAVPEVRGDRKKVTVLFCDIRGFSTIAESMAPEQVVLMLNEYFERMVDVVFRHQGTLDKFMGDGLMVLFGAPQDDPYQEEHALKAALEMQRELRRLRARQEAEGGLPLAIGIGINSGPAIVGNIGSSQRMEYTAIGDTVNLASRLESATREIGAEILVSEYTYNAVRGAFNARSVGSVRVKGRVEPVQAYAIDL
ncbi:MAG: HAMP domain-containing protein [Bryobacteraceae bacterium]|nr:HAMP domain-containing protein [Bryobacteraceae bacterium]